MSLDERYQAVGTYHDLQEPPQPAIVTPFIRSKAKRPRIYQSFSSPKSPPSQKTSNHLPADPTTGNPSTLSTPTNRSQRMYHSISSSFSMMSSSSQEAPPLQTTSTHLPGTSTTSPSSSFRGKRQRIYQSISSAFSRHTSPMQDFLEMFPSTPAQTPAPNPLPILPQSEAEGLLDPG